MSAIERCSFCNETEDYTTYTTRSMFLCSDKYCQKTICSDCWIEEVQCFDCERKFCVAAHLRTCNGCGGSVCIDCVDLESEQFDDNSAPSVCSICSSMADASSNEEIELSQNYVEPEEIAVRLRAYLEFEVEPLTSKVPAIMQLLEPVLQFREKLRRVYLNKRILNETRKQRIFNLCSKEWCHMMSENDKQCCGENVDAPIDEQGHFHRTELLK